MTNRVHAFVAATTIAAIGAGLLLYAMAPMVDPRYGGVVVCFIALSGVAHLLAYTLARNATGSIAFIPILAASALAPSWLTVVAIASTEVVGELVLRRSWIKALFNVAQHSLTASVAILAFLGSGGSSLLHSPAIPLPSFIVLFVVFMGLNSVLVSAVVALSQQKKITTVWRENTLGTIAYDVLAIPVVLGFALVYVHFGAIGSVLLALPLFGIRQQYKTNWQLEQVNQDLLQLMVAAIEANDPYTSGHSQRVARYAQMIARAAGLRHRQVERVRVAALLHDVGKIHEEFAPIIRKPDRLTAAEMSVIQTHAAKGAALVGNVAHLRDLAPSVRHHHENWDGTGYPDQIAGTRIPLFARIIKIADTIDAMTTDRPYRTAMGLVEVRRELTLYRGRQFDPVLCDAILSGSLLSMLLGGTATPSAVPRFPVLQDYRPAATTAAAR